MDIARKNNLKRILRCTQARAGAGVRARARGAARRVLAGASGTVPPAGWLARVRCALPAPLLCTR